MAGGGPRAAVSFLAKGFAVLRMQRGENRINPDFINTVHKCLDEVESNKSCRGLITTGEGKFYSNGLEVDWVKQQDRPTIDKFMGDFHDMLARLLIFPLPTVAAINGHAFAGGALLAMVNDFRVMNSEKGWLSLNEVFISLRLGDFAVKYVQAKVNPPVCRDLMVLGKRFTGPEAMPVGLADKIAPPPQLEKEAEKLLEAWLGKDGYPRQSLQNMKKDFYVEALKDVRSHRF